MELRVRITAILVLASSTFASAVVAADVIDVDLTQAGVNRSSSHPVTPAAHDFIMGESEWSAPQPDNPESPLHGMHGQCFGVTELQGDVIIGGGGYCTNTDADGDRLVTRWVRKEQLPGFITRGEWNVFEGSGKWEGATGSGTYETSRTASEGGRSRKLTGRITLR
jgi:hypothetical protein